MKPIAIITVLITLFVGASSNVLAQTNSFELKSPFDAYPTSGTVELTKISTGYEYTVTVRNLPARPPENGVYYLLWATLQDGRADNLGTVSNNAQLKGRLTTAPTQFFVTSEKERYPESVQGPRIVESPPLDPLALSSAAPVSTPIATDSAYTTPIGGPETGLGGSILWNFALTSLLGIGLIGLFTSIKKSLR